VLILLTPATPYGQVLLALSLLGAGDIAVITPIADVILSAVPRERTGSAAALNGAAMQIGGALGTAVLTSVLTAVARAAARGVLPAPGTERAITPGDCRRDGSLAPIHPEGGGERRLGHP